MNTTTQMELASVKLRLTRTGSKVARVSRCGRFLLRRLTPGVYEVLRISWQRAGKLS